MNFTFRAKNGADKFAPNDFIYLSIYSIHGCSISITVTFPHDIVEEFSTRKNRITMS